MSSKKYIFLSYSRKDYDFAMQLKDDLENVGFDVWVDQNKIVGGEVWRKSIADALNNSHTVVWVVSPDSVNSKYVNKELSFADGKDVCIIPVMYRKVEIPFPFHELQFVDVSSRYDSEKLDEIVKSINNPTILNHKSGRSFLKSSFLSLVSGVEKLLYVASIILFFVGVLYMWQQSSKESADMPSDKDKTVVQAQKVQQPKREPKKDTVVKGKEVKEVEAAKVEVLPKKEIVEKPTKVNKAVIYKQISGEKLSQRDAIYACKKAGFKLATLEELKLLANDKKVVEEIRSKNAFPYDFWSSTVYKKDSIKAYVFRFNNKSKIRVDINERFNFLCIKN
jgi:hypothetical protein